MYSHIENNKSKTINLDDVDSAQVITQEHSNCVQRCELMNLIIVAKKNIEVVLSQYKKEKNENFIRLCTFVMINLNTMELEIKKSNSFSSDDIVLIKDKISGFEHLVLEPENKQNITNLCTFPKVIENKDELNPFSWGKLILGLVLGTLAICIITASAIVLAASYGAATPLSMMGLVVASSLLVKVAACLGVVAGVGSLGGVAACTYNFLKSGPNSNPSEKDNSNSPRLIFNLDSGLGNP